MEYFYNITTVHQDCDSYVCAAIDPPTSDYLLVFSSADGTFCFITHCCLPDVSLSAVNKEKSSLLQCKALWTKVFAFCCDDCNPGTDTHAPCYIRASADSASTV